MNRWRPRLFAFALAVVFSAIAAGDGEKPPSKAETAKLKPSPEEQAAQDLLDRVRRDFAVKQQMNTHLADQHFKVGKAHFEMKDWERARRHLEKALALKPDHTEAARLLVKLRGLLGIEQGGAGRALTDLAKQRSVAIEMRKTELRNLFEKGKRLDSQGRHRQAIEVFTRAKAKAQALMPFVNAASVAEEAAARREKAREAIEQRRQADEKKRMKKAIEESRRLRDARRTTAGARTSAQLDQARALFAQRRFGQTRALCDTILRRDPACGPAIDLRAQADDAQWRGASTRALADRRTALDRHWMVMAAWTSPQDQLVSMPPELFEKVRNRRAEVVFLGKTQEPEEWERRVREKLTTQKIAFDFVETPLQDVLSFLSSLTDVTIVLDHKAVRDDPPNITLRVNDMTLEGALNWICKLAGLKYKLKDEAIYVARPDKLGDETTLRMYDVTDLTIEIKNFAGRKQALSTGEGHGGDAGGDLGEDFWGDFDDDDDDDDDDEKLTGKSLIEFIRRVLAPATWQDGEGRRGVIGDPFAFRGIGERDDRDHHGRRGEELADVVGLALGGHTWAAVRTRQ